MAREIQILNDEDTVIGYNYEAKLYYVTNKGTKTTRPTKEEALLILKIIVGANPLDTDSQPITLDRLQDLHDAYESLQTLSYSLADNGEYIHTIQLNTYETHPLTIDLKAKKLYVMNSDLIFDLTLDEHKDYRVPYLVNYYKDKLGLLITSEQMLALYDYLFTYYKPHYYIEITPRATKQDTLYYSNTIKLSNPDDSAPVGLTLTYNPNNIYNPSTSYKDVVYMNQNTRTIQLTEDIPTDLQTEDKVLITNAVTIINEQPFTADGTYTVTGIDAPNKIIQVEEPFPVSYEQQYLSCNLVASKTTIASISREDFKITLTNSVPETMQVGDTIYVHGTTQSIDQQSVSADGQYTIVSKSDNALIVQEQLPIDYTGTTAFVYKELPIAYIQSITSGALVYLFAEPTVIPSRNDEVSINNALYTVDSYTDKVIALTTQPTPYTLEFAQLHEPTQETLVNIEVTSSTLTNVPKGSFIVDDYLQAQAYTSLITSQPALPSEFENLLSKRVPKSISMLDTTATFLGLYSEVYTDKTT